MVNVLLSIYAKEFNPILFEEIRQTCIKIYTDIPTNSNFSRRLESYYKDLLGFNRIRLDDLPEDYINMYNVKDFTLFNVISFNLPTLSYGKLCEMRYYENLGISFHVNNTCTFNNLIKSDSIETARKCWESFLTSIATDYYDYVKNNSLTDIQTYEILECVGYLMTIYDFSDMRQGFIISIKPQCIQIT